MNGDGRHLDLNALEAYLRSTSPLAWSVDGPVQVTMYFEPVTERLGVEVPWDGSEIDPLDSYEYLTSARVVVAGANRVRVWILGREQLRDGYALLRSITDRVQLEGESSSQAIANSVNALGDLLRGARRLSVDAETGLFGELLVLRRLIGTEGPSVAATSWKGFHREEHDFGLHMFDVEVKTTTAESRRHWIHGTGQLVPSPGRPLWLLSVQLTDAGAGGESLPELVASIEVLLLAPDIPTFIASLGALGWRGEDAKKYRRRLQFRSAPAAFEVDGDFPVLDDSALIRAGLSHSLVPQVNYLLDLAGLKPATQPPESLSGWPTSR